MTRTAAFCILNRKAGRRTAGDDDLPEVLRILEGARFDVRVVETGMPEPSAATLAARARREGYGVVLAAGGDGTVGPAAGELLDSDVVLGILPFGRFMNIANSIELPLRPIEAAQVIARRKVRRVDVGEVAGRVFYENAGIGLDADAFGAARAVERVDWRQALRRARRVFTRGSHRITVSVDGAEPRAHRAMQVLVTNGRYYAWSFPVVPDADVADGLLNAVVFPRAGRRDLLRFLYAAWRREAPPFRPAHYRGREITIDSPDVVPVHADTQIVGPLPQTFRCRAGALAVFVP